MVEGGQVYKACMSGCMETETTLSSTVTPEHCPLPVRLCHLWPLRDAQANNSLRSMLRALLAGARKTLEYDVSSIQVSLIVHENWGDRLVHVRSALQETDVDIWWLQGLDHFVKCLGCALHLHGDCDDPYEPTDASEQACLLFKYPRSSVVGHIWCEECRNYWIESAFSSSESSHDKISACRKGSEEPARYDAPLRGAFQKLIARSELHSNQRLGVMLNLGELAEDQTLIKALRQSLVNKRAKGSSIEFTQVRNLSPDLTFAGARAMAKYEVSFKDHQRLHAEAKPKSKAGPRKFSLESEQQARRMLLCRKE